MKERLEKLAEQAGIFRPKEFYQHIDALQLEKFAELIVKECIDTVLDSSVEYATRPQIAEELKEHFGVEE